MDNNKTSGKGERIAIPSHGCKPSEDAGEQPKLQVASASSDEITSEVTFAIACDGEVTFKDDTDGYDWEDICSRDFAIFRPGAKHSEVAKYFDGLMLTKEHKAEILEAIFG